MSDDSIFADGLMTVAYLFPQPAGGVNNWLCLTVYVVVTDQCL